MAIVGYNLGVQRRSIFLIDNIQIENVIKANTFRSTLFLAGLGPY